MKKKIVELTDNGNIIGTVYGLGEWQGKIERGALFDHSLSAETVCALYLQTGESFIDKLRSLKPTVLWYCDTEGNFVIERDGKK